MDINAIICEQNRAFPPKPTALIKTFFSFRSLLLYIKWNNDDLLVLKHLDQVLNLAFLMLQKYVLISIYW